MSDIHSSSTVLATDSALEDGAALGHTRCLIVFEPTRSWVLSLPDSGRIMVGRHSERAAPSKRETGGSGDRYIWLRDPAVSRQHMLFEARPDEVLLTDCESKNGVCVNGTKIPRPWALMHGDVITIPGSSRNARFVFCHGAPRSIEINRIVELAELRRILGLRIRANRGADSAAELACLRIGEPVRRTELEAYLDRQTPKSICGAWYDAHSLLLASREDSDEDMVALLDQLLADPPIKPEHIRGGLAQSPLDGQDGETLILRAVAATRAAPPGRWMQAADAVVQIQVNDKVALLADPIMLQIYDLLELLAKTDEPVIIQGETGTGKEMVAQTIHFKSRRRNGPFVAVNCAALPETIIEAELFGTEPGAFTGARSKYGLFEQAQQGTLFLDELGELPLHLQPRLLRVLEDQRVRRVGGTSEKQVDVRLVAATNRNLAEDVAAKRFRADLYFRLNVGYVCLPPLRARRAEIPILARSFLEKACSDQTRSQLTLSAGAIEQLLQYAWPGNVRDLLNTVKRIAIAVPRDQTEVRAHHVAAVLSPGAPAAFVAAPAQEAPAFKGIQEEISELLRQRLAEIMDMIKTTVSSAAPRPSRLSDSLQHFNPIDEEIRKLEQQRMMEAMAATQGNKTRAAELIGMSRTSFKQKFKDYGLEPSYPSLQASAEDIKPAAPPLPPSAPPSVSPSVSEDPPPTAPASRRAPRRGPR